ncbi:succinylglutamate desuccinylase/aspartoacylase family protein [Haloquadratum walsbyi]|jgi:Succinylglutamate desuccinylase|uniref:Succinylglutamate desuccinylase n=1 Tax=Haloquadratum walsbyi J07HQW2 TaxID=1238425 RepID=U1NH34_9EURY|nr:succinylglutamate desuccinylase/aspartoacylase family protein [Haloquadratum walsbyi]ERG96183.1 MAG: succinylglutamate desuccinylase [Haloquadratum walsbyi J07HQW2]
MRVHTLGPEDGDKTPTVAVVGGVHGDEPCGVRAVERFCSGNITNSVQRRVKFIIANERALERNVRYTEADLNRLFPGDPESEIYEERLASDLYQEIKDCVTLGFHSTVSFDQPFGTLANLTAQKATIMQALPLDHAADFSGYVTGRSVNLSGFVNVEAGYQGSEAAAENAYRCLIAYLRVMNVLPEEAEVTPTTHYQVQDAIEKTPGERYRVHANNFEQVASGIEYATTEAGKSLIADSEFYPVLMSADGHDTLLGYAAERTGEIDVAVTE